MIRSLLAIIFANILLLLLGLNMIDALDYELEQQEIRNKQLFNLD